MADLRDAIIRLKPREHAGSRSADRFDYQKDWAICKLLQLHESNADYLIAFDVFDDVIVLNSEATPDRISFFQIKTRDMPPMRLAELLRRKQGKDNELLSILGKLYYNKVAFPDHTECLTLVSNVPFEIKLNDGSAKSTSKTLLCCTDLESSVRSKIGHQLTEEHRLASEAVFAHFMFLEVSDLPLKGHDTHTLGKIAEFLDRLNPSGSFRVPLVYRTLADEVRRKNNYHSDPAAYDAFVREKAISRSAFAEILKGVVAYEDIDSRWERVEARLNADQMSVFTIRKLHDQFRRIAIDRLSQVNLSLKRLQASVKRHLDEAENRIHPNSLALLLDSVVAAIRAEPSAAEHRRHDDDYIKALALATLYEP